MQNHFEFVESIGFYQNENAPDVFRLALGSTTITKNILVAKDSDGWTILHWIGFALSETGCIGSENCNTSARDVGHLVHPRPCHSRKLCDWGAIMRDILVAGSLIHGLDDAGQTPLCVLLCYVGHLQLPPRAERWYSDARMIQLISCTAHTWMYDLYASRVDLQLYGETETALGLKDKTNSYRRLNFTKEKFHLVGFSYGPTLVDWKFWFSEPTDYLAGIFWAMIENSQDDGNSSPYIPGSWMEDGEISESGSEWDSGA